MEQPEAPKIWKKFKLVSEWLSTPQGNLPCRAKCSLCQVRWRKTGSAYVNYMVHPESGKSVYVCSPCVTKIENHESEPSQASQPCV